MPLMNICLRGDTKAEWEAANPILKEREIGIEWETTIGVGRANIKIGKVGGTTHWNDLDYAVVGATADTISSIETIAEENPALAIGDNLPTIAGKLNNQRDFLKTKLGYERLSTLADSLSGLSNKDFVGIMDFINNKKFDKANLYNGTDSTSTELGLTANVGHDLQEQINNVNSDFIGYEPKVVITSYTNENRYIFPSDGILVLLCHSSVSSSIGFYITGMETQDTVIACSQPAGGIFQSVVIPVFEGMEAWRQGWSGDINNTSAYFFALKKSKV